MVISEVQCLKKMRHPNIIAYRRAWTEGNKMYILMEYASRGTLKDLLERCGSPLRKEVSKIIIYLINDKIVEIIISENKLWFVYSFIKILGCSLPLLPSNDGRSPHTLAKYSSP